MQADPPLHFVFFVRSAHGAVLKDFSWGETHPLGGSETSPINLAAALERRGHRVEIITEFEDIDNVHCDVFVANRVWQIFDDKSGPGKLNYLWCHDDIDQKLVAPLRDPAVAKRVYDRCDGVVTISHYQLAGFVRELNLPLGKYFLSPHGVAVERFSSDAAGLRGRPPRCYYASAPLRGLELLLDAWPHVTELAPQAELLIFSSLAMYRSPDTDETQELIDRARSLRGVRYIGSVGQAELRQYAETCRALAYPCTFAETGCLVALDAMAAGCAVVSTALGALPETAWQNPLVPPVDGCLEQWMVELGRVLLDEEHYLAIARRNLALVQFNTWDIVAERWCKRVTQDGRTRSASM